MEKGLIRLLAVLLTIYFAAIIVFKIYNYNITYIINALFIGVYILLMLIKKETKYKINGFIVFYALFVVLSLGSSLWGVDFSQSSFRSMQLFLLLLNMFVIYNCVKEFHLEYTFLNGILLGSFVNFVIMLQLVPVSFDIVTLAGGGRALGTVGNPNMLAIVMMISILVSFIYINMKDRISKLFFYYQYINILLSLYLIFLSMSKKGIIFGSLLILIYLFLSIKRPENIIRLIVIICLGIIVAVYFVDYDHLMNYYHHIEGRFSSFSTQLSSDATDGSTGERIFLVNTGLSLLADRPLFGYGIASFSLLNDRNIYAHNNYIELLVGVGLVGTVIYYCIYIFIIKTAYALKDNYLKLFFILFIFILLAMDMALVSYGMKVIIYTLLFIVILTESSHFKSKKKL